MDWIGLSRLSKWKGDLIWHWTRTQECSVSCSDEMFYRDTHFMVKWKTKSCHGLKNVAKQGDRMSLSSGERENQQRRPHFLQLMKERNKNSEGRWRVLWLKNLLIGFLFFAWVNTETGGENQNYSLENLNKSINHSSNKTWITLLQLINLQLAANIIVFAVIQFSHVQYVSLLLSLIFSFAFRNALNNTAGYMGNVPPVCSHI